jgi:hypothetical protein
MKNKLLFFLFFIVKFSQVTYSQVELYSTANPTVLTYTTLKGAFDAINAGTRTGTVFINITGNTSETLSAVLNASGSGSASYTSVLITPNGGGARTISGTIASNPIVDLNGADMVTIDGLNTGSSSLTISNLSTSNSANTSTIRLYRDATSNIITNCSILGSATMPSGTNGGNIFFSGNAVATGSDNNTISFCNIGPADGNSPSMGIYCGGTNTAGLTNTGNIFNNNNFFDIFLANGTSTMLESRTGTSDSTITNNKFYQSTPKVFTAGTTHATIFVQNTALGENFTITGNTIGYANSSGTGFYELSGSSAKFWGIHTNLLTAGVSSTISNNTISNISLTGVSSTGTDITGSPFVAIGIRAGQVTSNNNTIGSQASTGSLVFSSTGSADTDLYGMFNSSASNWIANNNSIGGITVTNTTATNTRFYFYPFRAENGTANSCTATGNIIGGTVANSIQNNSTSIVTQVTGMYTNDSAMIATSNIIRNLTVNAGTGASGSASAVGILIDQAGSALGHQLSKNTIYNISNTSTGSHQINGIYFNGNNSMANIVDSNFIYNLNSASTNSASTMNGILTSNGITTYSNNVIDIGVGVNTAIALYGIFELNNGTNNFWYNSIYVGGSPTSGTSNSYAFSSVRVTATRSYRNNIFWNARSNSGATSKNYIVRVGGASANPAGLTINNNVYYSTGTGSVFGLFNGVDRASLTDWRTAVGQDVDSFNEDPKYLDPTNTITPDLHIQASSCTNVVYTGALVGITVDYDNQARSATIPVIGADEVSNNSTIWKGTVWTNSAPTLTKAALIVGNYNSTTLSSIDACSLRINSPATLTITANKYVNIQTDLTVRTGATLDVLDQGSLVQIDDTGINTCPGSFFMRRTAFIKLQDYVYWSSPVTNFSVGSISTATPADKIWKWNPTVGNSNGGEGNWEYASGNMAGATGYIVRGPAGYSNSSNTAFTANFTGVPNNGIFSPTINRGNNTGAGSNGPNGILRTTNDDNWNLLGNPYPSAIGVNEFLAANSAIDGFVKIWTHATLPSTVASDPFYGDFISNYAATDYTTINSTGSTSGATDYKIASGQGFFVLMNPGTPVDGAGSATVTFNNAMRSSSFDNNQFFRNSNQKNRDLSRIWLDLVSPVETTRMLVGYVEGATQERDRLYDAITDYKSAQNFYSLINDEIMTIQGRSLPFQDNDKVNLGIKASANGEFKIAIAEVDGLFKKGNQNIFLEDKKENVIHNLTVSPYSFNANQGIDNNRFVLRYTNPTLTNNDFENLLESVFVNSNGNEIKIKSNVKNIKSYEIHDVLGRRLDLKKNINKNTATSSVEKNNQTLIVKIMLENGYEVIKKVIF